MKDTKELQVLTKYKDTCIEIWNIFLIKHGLVDEDGIVYDFEPMGGTDDYNSYSFINVGDYYLNLDDAILDLVLDCPVTMFFDWYDYNMDHICDGYDNVNYRSYIRGFRHKERTKYQQFLYKVKGYMIMQWGYYSHWWSNRPLRKKFRKEMKEIIKNYKENDNY